MIDTAEVLDELAASLRSDRLDVHVDHDAEVIHVGAALRGDKAQPVDVRLGAVELREYLTELNGPRGSDDGRPDFAIGLLMTLLIESLTAVHDGENNLTTAVRLERGSRGHLGLIEDRADPGPPTPLPGDGRYGWVAERPENLGRDKPSS